MLILHIGAQVWIALCEYMKENLTRKPNDGNSLPVFGHICIKLFKFMGFSA